MEEIAKAIKTEIKISANYDHIELTEEELAKAIHDAKRAKEARLKTEEYSKRLLQKPVYPKWNFDELKKMVLMNNPDFIIDEHNEEIFDTLCLYFSGDQSFEMQDDFSLNKGLLLFGPIGCGKTSLMRMFQVNTFRPFTVTNCRNIADSYSKNGSDALFEYSQLQQVYPEKNFGISHAGRCFDDLGTEESKRNFGNQVNVMQDIIYKIYDGRKIGDFHITTNLNSKEIDDDYGYRIRSRMREMFNIIKFGKDAPDRRK